MMSDKRQQIVETAYRLFRADGYHAVGIDRIIAEAGVAKMTMYRHFRAKDELICAVLRFRAERFERQLDRLADVAPNAAARIETIVGWYERWFARPDFHGCAFAHALAEYGDPRHPVFQAASAQKEAFEARLRALLLAETDKAQATRTAAVLAMLFEGATLKAQMGRAEEAIRGLRDGTQALLARAGIRS
ncbi:TetR/AcrR family transcriptional regulator [Aureimonas sp. AU40]|uniref:TetR/AcrR family transcriptional regulator n=1 Tax=Aureimonas sp. AU40 TaxID=1637747 RepID=UPI000781290C|nr:TetR/AcrR family transcriptional regulator [Aureimonas sp. AU40]